MLEAVVTLLTHWAMFCVWQYYWWCEVVYWWALKKNTRPNNDCLCRTSSVVITTLPCIVVKMIWQLQPFVDSWHFWKSDEYSACIHIFHLCIPHTTVALPSVSMRASTHHIVLPCQRMILYTHTIVCVNASMGALWSSLMLVCLLSSRLSFSSVIYTSNDATCSLIRLYHNCIYHMPNTQ